MVDRCLRVAAHTILATVAPSHSTAVVHSVDDALESCCYIYCTVLLKVQSRRLLIASACCKLVLMVCAKRAIAARERLRVPQNTSAPKLCTRVVLCCSVLFCSVLCCATVRLGRFGFCRKGSPTTVGVRWPGRWRRSSLSRGPCWRRRVRGRRWRLVPWTWRVGLTRSWRGMLRTEKSLTR